MSVEERLLDAGYEGSVYLTCPDYEEAIIGVTTDGQVAYDYELMVGCLMEEGCNEEEAREWIDYNVIRGLPYMGENRPVVVCPLYE